MYVLCLDILPVAIVPEFGVVTSEDCFCFGVVAQRPEEPGSHVGIAIFQHVFVTNGLAPRDDAWFICTQGTEVLLQVAQWANGEVVAWASASHHVGGCLELTGVVVPVVVVCGAMANSASSVEGGIAVTIAVFCGGIDSTGSALGVSSDTDFTCIDEVLDRATLGSVEL